jgi:glucokinase
MVLKADGPPCGCGNHGCLEALTRSDLLAEAAGAASVAEAVSMANAGGERARSAIDEAARWIGLGLANVTTLLAPDVIVIGGGIAQAGELLFRPLREELALRSPLVLADTYQVLAASLGTDAGAMGAAIMIRNRRIAGEGS